MQGVSIFTWFGYILTMQERFKLIKEAGFDGVLLWWGDEFKEIDGDRRLHPDMARKEDLFIENIHTPYINANHLWCDNMEGDRQEKLLACCIDDCYTFEIPTAVVHLSHGPYTPACSSTGLDRINRLVELAERKNVNIAIENLNKLEYNDFVFSNIKSDRLGFCFDSGHENCYTKGASLLGKYKSKLMALHLHDNDGTGDQHLLPFEGSIGWNKIIKKLSTLKYEGSIALEVDPNNFEKEDREKPHEYLKRAYNAATKLNNLWGLGL